MSEITDYVQEEAGQTAEIIWGTGFDPSLADSLRVTVIATGFNSNQNTAPEGDIKPSKVVLDVQSPAVAEIIPEASSVASSVEIVFEERTVEGPLANNDPENSSVSEDKTEIEYLNLTVEDLNNSKGDALPPLDLYRPEKGAEDIFAPISENTPVSEDLFTPVTDKVPLASFDSKPAPGSEKTKEDLYRQNERMIRLKEISHRLKSPSGLKDLESQPAYIRRNIKLEQNTDNHAISGSSVSIEDGEVKIVKENRFLHGNVD
jgi:cell division protein FtsZ